MDHVYTLRLRDHMTSNSSKSAAVLRSMFSVVGTWTFFLRRGQPHFMWFRQEFTGEKWCCLGKCCNRFITCPLTKICGASPWKVLSFIEGDDLQRKKGTFHRKPWFSNPKNHHLFKPPMTHCHRVTFTRNLWGCIVKADSIHISSSVVLRKIPTTKVASPLVSYLKFIMTHHDLNLVL